MAIAFVTLLKRLSELENQDWEDVSLPAAKRKQYVSALNQALRWVWRDDNPRFAFPFSVSSDTVTVTDGAIALSDLGDGTWCSLWSTDPRPANSGARPIHATVGLDAVHPVTAETSVFAFFRTAVPQATYATDATYDTPEVPDILQDILPLKAMHMRLLSLREWDGLKAMASILGEPDRIRDKWRAGLQNSNICWREHALALGGEAV